MEAIILGRLLAKEWLEGSLVTKGLTRLIILEALRSLRERGGLVGIDQDLSGLMGEQIRKTQNKIRYGKGDAAISQDVDVDWEQDQKVIEYVNWPTAGNNSKPPRSHWMTNWPPSATQMSFWPRSCEISAEWPGHFALSWHIHLETKQKGCILEQIRPGFTIRKGRLLRMCYTQNSELKNHTKSAH
ncbi:hypothetical protein [Leisingera sp. ANG-DT]|uniref:hypothetical protein n=1 Tax=Leisingera sp. ANG-DT TaxID=1577897 RepID=UPI0005809EFE|nr:hypothetical protein [Leisingera sp. ANG-DT]KIC14610.1 hypothetical protein RA21_18890 [Leisingera sp. ANG-DT]